VTRILLLHYLIHADGNPLTGKWVAYKDIPGASSMQVFLQEGSLNRYSEGLENQPGLLKRRASDSGGSSLRLGMRLSFFMFFPVCHFNMSFGKEMKSFRRPSSFSLTPLWAIILH